MSQEKCPECNHSPHYPGTCVTVVDFLSVGCGRMCACVRDKREEAPQDELAWPYMGIPQVGELQDRLSAYAKEVEELKEQLSGAWERATMDHAEIAHLKANAVDKGKMISDLKELIKDADPGVNLKLRVVYPLGEVLQNAYKNILQAVDGGDYNLK